MIFRSVTVTVDGELRVHEIEQDASFGTLKHLQEEVHGYIELVSLKRDLDLFVNEEGAYSEDRNPLLETMATLLGWQPPLYGPGVFTGGSDDEGNTLSLTEDQVNGLIIFANRARLLTTST